MIWFLNSWEYLFYLIILFTYNTWTGETEDTISLVDHLVLVSSWVLVIAGERIIQRQKNQVLKIWQGVENKGKQRELSDHWKSINAPKKTKRLTGIQVLTKDFTSHKYRKKSLNEKKVT